MQRVAHTLAVLLAVFSCGVTCGAGSDSDEVGNLVARWGCKTAHGSLDPTSVEGDDCDVVIRAHDGREIVLYSGSIRSPRLETHGADVVELIVSCGSSCRYSYFADRIHAQTSGGYFNVIAVAGDEGLVAYSAGSAVRIAHMFGGDGAERTIRMKAERAGVIADRVESASFLAGGTQFVITYRSDPDGEIVSETVGLGSTDDDGPTTETTR